MITIHKTITSATISTPLGNMVAIGDEQKLYFLQFEDSQSLKNDLLHLERQTQSKIVAGITQPIALLKKELEEYFSGTLKEFKTPIFLHGTNFQKNVWQALMKIPYSKTRSYKNLAQVLNSPQASRAVGNANSKNVIVIVIPCHRIINSNGQLGGYSAGIERKKWLLAHENK